MVVELESAPAQAAQAGWSNGFEPRPKAGSQPSLA
jgi:hypothetical protein